MTTAPDDSDLDPVDDFWSATALEVWNVEAFWVRVLRSAPPAPILPPLMSDAGGEALPTVDDGFQRRLAARRSGRDFSPEALNRTSLARLLVAAGVDSDGRRVFPRAGDFDSVHLYVLARRIDGCGFGTAWRYDHLGHTLVPVGPAGTTDRAPANDVQTGTQPSADISVGEAEFSTMCSLGDDDPAAVVLFIIEPSRTIARYGIHGERFGLQEVGHAMQNVLLRMSEDDLTGYPIGGLVDSLVLDALGLTGLDVRVGGGLAVGYRNTPTRRRRRFGRPG